MKKIATVTVHAAISYGAMLQAYALQRAIIELGHQSEVIDYRNKMIEGKNKTFPVRIDKSLARRLKDIVSAPLRYDRNRKFWRFMQQEMRLSPQTYRRGDDMTSLTSQYDSFFVGSDQVWNPTHADFDPVYFLQFVTDVKKRNSYAASFGFDQIPAEMKSDYYRRLQEFNHLSVREASGRAIIQDLLNRSAEVSLDPTMLLTKEQWQEVMTPSPVNGYVLIYEVNQASDDTYKLAHKLAKKHNLKVIAITQKIRSWADLVAHQTDPKGLLGYINNARFVFTDSFHGTVFSILFEKQFMFCQNQHADVNGRMLNLLELTGLDSRKKIENIETGINWQDVKQKIEIERQKSLNYLSKAIGE